MKFRRIQSFRSRAARGVAQICNLLYRRFVICQALPSSNDSPSAEAQPTTSRRYSRLQICATWSCAFRVLALAVALGIAGLNFRAVANVEIGYAPADKTTGTPAEKQK